MYVTVYLASLVYTVRYCNYYTIVVQISSLTSVLYFLCVLHPPPRNLTTAQYYAYHAQYVAHYYQYSAYDASYYAYYAQQYASYAQYYAYCAQYSAYYAQYSAQYYTVVKFLGRVQASILIAIGMFTGICMCSCVFLDSIGIVIGNNRNLSTELSQESIGLQMSIGIHNCLIVMFRVSFHRNSKLCRCVFCHHGCSQDSMFIVT